MGDRDVTGQGDRATSQRKSHARMEAPISILPLSVSAPSPWPDQTDNTAFTQAAQQLAFFPWVLFAVSSLPVPVSRTRPPHLCLSLFAECLLCAMLCARSCDAGLKKRRSLPQAAHSLGEEVRGLLVGREHQWQGPGEAS